MRSPTVLHVWPCERGHTYTTVCPRDGRAGCDCAAQVPLMCPTHTAAECDTDRSEELRLGRLFYRWYRGDESWWHEVGGARWSLRLSGSAEGVEATLGRSR